MVSSQCRYAGRSQWNTISVYTHTQHGRWCFVHSSNIDRRWPLWGGSRLGTFIGCIQHEHIWWTVCGLSFSIGRIAYTRNWMQFRCGQWHRDRPCHTRLINQPYRWEHTCCKSLARCQVAQCPHTHHTIHTYKLVCARVIHTTPAIDGRQWVIYIYSRVRAHMLLAIRNSWSYT